MNRDERIAMTEVLATIAVGKMTKEEMYNFLYAAHMDHLGGLPENDLLDLADLWMPGHPHGQSS